ncbi:hypothetical protein PG987_010206 [Apiospora arundinis]
MPLLRRAPSDTSWWPVLSLKRGYNGTADDATGESGSEHEKESGVNGFKQEDSKAVSPTLTRTITTTAPLTSSDTPSSHTSATFPSSIVEPSTILSSTAMLPTPGTDEMITDKPLAPTSPSIYQAMAEASGFATASSPMIQRLPAASLLSSTLERTQANPTDSPTMSLPNSDHEHQSGLSPDEITIIVAVVVSFVVFLVLLAIAIHCAILRRRKQEALERARRIQARPPTSHLPPALKKPSISNLRVAVPTAAAHVSGEDEKGLDAEDDYDRDEGNHKSKRPTGEFRIVIRPPPGYRSPRSEVSIQGTYSHPPPLGSRRPSATTLNNNSPTAAVDGSVSTDPRQQHWSLNTENGSVFSGPTPKGLMNRLSLTTTESDDENED